MRSAVTLYSPDGEKALGGALEGSERLSREMASWVPRFGSPDQVVNSAKDILDARSTDLAQDDALPQAAITTHQDALVGAKYSLNYKPDTDTLGVDPDDPWVTTVQRVVEARWNAIAESRACWLDAGRRRTFSQMCRQAVASFTLTGEILAPAEWLLDKARPCKTAVHLISPSRLSNPKGGMDRQYDSTLGTSLSRGVEKDYYGRIVAYNVQRGHPGDLFSRYLLDWDRVVAELPWGRKQMIYVADPMLVEQTRGLGDMTPALVHMRMSKKHGQVTLQNAVVNATYAAAIESDLPPPEIALAMGAAANGGTAQAGDVVEGWEQSIGSYMAMIAAYLSGAPNVQVDGAKMPVLPVGTKFKLLNAGNGGSNFEAFQRSIDRKSAAALGMSYEEYTRDYSQLSYSGGKMSSGKTERFMNGRAAVSIEPFACDVFTLWLEEQFAQNAIPLPPSWTSRDNYYDPLQKEAISRCSWIGTGKGQIDELKETQAAILRINSGLSTWEDECGRMGRDWRDMAAQQKRERALFGDAGLDFSSNAQKTTSGASTQSTLQGKVDDNEP
jgi:lambda family phage portal protein